LVLDRKQGTIISAKRKTEDWGGFNRRCSVPVVGTRNLCL